MSNDNVGNISLRSISHIQLYCAWRWNWYAKNPLVVVGHTIPYIWIKELYVYVWKFLLNSFMNFGLAIPTISQQSNGFDDLQDNTVTQYSQQKNCQNNSMLKQKQTKGEVFTKKNSSNHIFCIFGKLFEGFWLAAVDLGQAIRSFQNLRKSSPKRQKYN